MKRISCIISAFFCCLHLLQAQDTTRQNKKIYESWISFSNKPVVLKGILYEIKDTTLLVTNLLFTRNYPDGNYDISEIKSSDIKIVHTRRYNNVKRGALIGGFAGLCTGIIMTAIVSGMEDGGFDSWGPVIYTYTGISGAAAGALMGIVFGSIRDRIEIDGSYENFNIARSRLQKYSFVHEYNDGSNIPAPGYEHRNYIGMVMGPSFPLGEFKSFSDNENSGKLKTGYFDNILNIGYRFTKKYGISMIVFDSQYDVSNNEAEIWYGLSGIMGGPMLTIPVRNKLYFDLKPRIGFSDVQLTVDDVNKLSSVNFGLNFNASLQYNFSRRWCILTETGYLYSHPKFQDGNEINVQAFHLDLGIAYRFR